MSLRAFLCALILCALIPSGTAAAEKIELQSGDILNGDVIESTEAYVLLQHPVLGQIKVPRSEIKPPEEKKEKPGLFGTSFMKGWTREVNFGVNGAEGNTVNFNLTGGFDLKAENERRRWTWTGRYIFKTTDNSTTDNNARVQTRYDWLLPESRYFLFVEPLYDFDQFKDWKHRITLSGGPGYGIIQRESLDLRTGIGVSGQKEFEGEAKARFGGYWSLNLEWKLSDRQSLTASNQIFPYIVNTPGEYRNLSTAAWKLKLTEDPTLNLNLGIENDYNSDAPPEDHKNDFKYFGTLGAEF
jgi:putative salt-induced outer membrane protein YdiY